MGTVRGAQGSCEELGLPRGSRVLLGGLGGNLFQGPQNVREGGSG